MVSVPPEGGGLTLIEKQLPSVRRAHKKALLREQILRQALSLFARHGYDAVSVEEIAEASFCSRSTFHRYFGTKEDLLFPGVDQWLAEFEKELAAADPADDPWAIAREGAIHGVSGFVRALDPELRASFARLWLSGPVPRRRYLEIVLDWERVLRNHFGRSIGVGSESSLECQLLASLVSSALRAALNTAVSTGADVDDTAERAFDLVESSPLVTELRAAARAQNALHSAHPEGRNAP